MTAKTKTLPDKQRKNRVPPEGRRFQKGKSGNPAGRPKKLDCITSVLKDELEKPKPGDKQKRTWAEVVVAAMLAKAAKGDVRAAALILDRTEGKVTQPVEADSHLVISWQSEVEDRLHKARERAANRESGD